MSITEADGHVEHSDITSYAKALFLAGLQNPRPAVTDGVPLITLTLNGDWAWPVPVTSDDEALKLIGDGIYNALLEAVSGPVLD